MALYADTSVLVSYFGNDTLTPQAQLLLGSITQPLLFTDLHRLEMVNAFQLGIFRRAMTVNQTQAAWSQALGYVRRRRLLRQKLDWQKVLRNAAKLGGRHSALCGTRSLDILHVAAAQVIHVSEFLTFDARQKAVALAVGLTVRP